MADHSSKLIVLMVTNLVFYIINQILGFFNMADTEKLFGFKLYNKTVSEGSNDRFLEITPASATFSIWGAIYIWQAVWILYGLANICRRASDGPVYTSPTLLTPLFFCVSILNWACVITWTFLWGWDYVWLAFVFLALTFITIYICIGLSYKALAEHMDTLIKQNRKIEIWLIRIFVQNGLGFYGAWCTIATLLNLAMALSYDTYPLYDQSKSSTISLSILCVELIVYVAVDWTILDKYSRYTVSPYTVVIVALTGSIAQNWDPAKRNSLLTAGLLGAAILAFLIKVIIMFVRHFRDRKRQEVMLPTIQLKQDEKL